MALAFVRKTSLQERGNPFRNYVRSIVALNRLGLRNRHCRAARPGRPQNTLMRLATPLPRREGFW